MSTLKNRPNTVLLIVDLQNGVVAGAHQRDAVLANGRSLVEKARRQRVPVVWVQHSDEQLARGSGEWRIVPELTPDNAEPHIEKNYGDSFEGTPLENVLSSLGVGRLIVVGAETDACIAHTSLYWTCQTAPGRKAGTIKAEAVDFRGFWGNPAGESSNSCCRP